jgi:prefoldin subunit 5
MTELPPFDELKEMAEKNPEALEALRKKMVNEVIERASEEKRDRLKGLQFRIDAKIKTSRTPFESMCKIYDEMMDSFDQLNEQLNVFTSAANKLQSDLKVLEGKELKDDAKVNLKIIRDK